MINLSLHNFEWQTENGDAFLTHELRPIVDEQNGRLYAATVLGSVVLLKEYESYRKHCARDAAITFWGNPAQWQSLDEHIVTCVCAGCPQPTEATGSAWRVTSAEAGTLRARYTSRSDHGVEIELDEHTLYTSPYVILGGDTRSIEIDMFETMVLKLGEPYNMSTGEINPSYAQMYRKQ